jgi:putative tryptophan/tyrosine transport system substrate-binding protein
LALCAPVLLHAQPAKIWRLGMFTVNARPAAEPSSFYTAFLQELRVLGYRERDNLVIEWRHTEGEPERRIKEAAALMTWKPDAVFTVGGVNAIALRNADASIPIIVGAAGDLVGMRLAASLSRPGGNVTGLQILSPDLAAKRLQLLKHLVPKLQRVAVIHAIAEEDQGFYDRIYADLQSAASGASEMALLRLPVATADDLQKAFNDIVARKANAALVIASTSMTAHRARIIALAAQRRVPVMYELAGDVEEGGLIAYGPKLDDMFRRGAVYVHRVFTGTRPSELPIQQPTEFELVINRKAARALGLDIPPSLLVQASRVIE